MNNSDKKDVPDDFKINTGTFGRIVGFEERTVLIEICNEIEATNYSKQLQDGEQFIKLNNGYETNKPVFAIKYSEDINEPYFKSSFCDYIFCTKNHLMFHSYPFTKESASTIHSLQGKTMTNKEKIIYYMHSIKKKDLEGVIFNQVGAWKGSLPNLLYVAVTRSKVHTNFKLMTKAKIFELRNILGVEKT